jgi:hypothetical protein
MRNNWFEGLLGILPGIGAMAARDFGRSLDGAHAGRRAFPSLIRGTSATSRGLSSGTGRVENPASSTLCAVQSPRRSPSR